MASAGDAAVVADALPVNSFMTCWKLLRRGGLQRLAGRLDAEQDQPAGQHTGDRHDQERRREAPRRVGAEHDQRGQRPADVAESVGQRDPGGARAGGEVLGGVGVEHRDEQADRGRRDEAEHDDDRRRDEVADHEQRDRPHDGEQRERVLALEAVAEVSRRVRAEQEADARDDQVGGAVGQAVALVGEQGRGQRQPAVVADVVDEPDRDEQRHAAGHRAAQERRDRDALGRRLVGHRLGLRQPVAVDVLERGLLGRLDDLRGLLGASLRDQPPRRGRAGRGA